MTIREAKQIVTINSVWEVYNLPGKPGKSCKAPHRKDRSPSFSVYEDGRRFKDFGTGENGDVINFISLIKGIPEAQAYKDLFNLAGAGSNIPKLPLKLKDKEKTQSEYFNYYQNLRRGTTYEMYELAELRGIGFNGIKLAHDRGHLRFTSSKAGIIWALADLRGSFRQDRLLSGKKIRLKNGESVKTRTLGKLSEPLGINDISSFQCVLIVEGGPDFLAANFLISQTRKEELYGVIGMLGAHQILTSKQVELLRGKRVRIFPHMDEAGLKGAKNWQSALLLEGVDSDIYDFDSITRDDGQLVTDLNDLLQVGVDDWENDPLIRNPLMGLLEGEK